MLGRARDGSRRQRERDSLPLVRGWRARRMPTSRCAPRRAFRSLWRGVRESFVSTWRAGRAWLSEVISRRPSASLRAFRANRRATVAGNSTRSSTCLPGASSPRSDPTGRLNPSPQSWRAYGIAARAANRLGMPLQSSRIPPSANGAVPSRDRPMLLWRRGTRRRRYGGISASRLLGSLLDPPASLPFKKTLFRPQKSADICVQQLESACRPAPSAPAIPSRPPIRSTWKSSGRRPGSSPPSRTPALPLSRSGRELRREGRSGRGS